jgi:hypothetical protein
MSSGNGRLAANDCSTTATKPEGFHQIHRSTSACKPDANKGSAGNMALLFLLPDKTHVRMLQSSNANV